MRAHVWQTARFDQAALRKARALCLLALPALLALTSAPAQAAGIDSAYTKLKLDACAVLKTYEEDGGVDLKCSGYRGIPVFVSEGDLRTTVAFGKDSANGASFGPFNSPGETVEWRLSGGKPFAAILRFHVDPGDGSGKTVSVLGIYTIGDAGRESCPVGYVDASVNKNANVLARQVADEAARGFACDVDRPRYHGAVSELGGSATAVRD